MFGKVTENKFGSCRCEKMNARIQEKTDYFGGCKIGNQLRKDCMELLKIKTMEGHAKVIHS